MRRLGRETVDQLQDGLFESPPLVPLVLQLNNDFRRLLPNFSQRFIGAP